MKRTPKRAVITKRVGTEDLVFFRKGDVVAGDVDSDGTFRATAVVKGEKTRRIYPMNINPTHYRIEVAS